MAVLPALDKEKQTRGVWQTYPDSDIEVCIARYGNPEHLEAQRREIETASRSKPDGKLTAEETDAALLRAECVLVTGFRKLQLVEGGPDIGATFESVLSIAQDERYSLFWAWIMNRARRTSQYMDTSPGKSPSASDGSSVTGICESNSSGNEPTARMSKVS